MSIEIMLTVLSSKRLRAELKKNKNKYGIWHQILTEKTPIFKRPKIRGI